MLASVFRPARTRSITCCCTPRNCSNPNTSCSRVAGDGRMGGGYKLITAVMPTPRRGPLSPVLRFLVRLGIDRDLHPRTDQRLAVLPRRADPELPRGRQYRVPEVRVFRVLVDDHAVIHAEVRRGLAGD